MTIPIFIHSQRGLGNPHILQLGMVLASTIWGYNPSLEEEFMQKTKQKAAIWDVYAVLIALAAALTLGGLQFALPYVA